MKGRALSLGTVAAVASILFLTPLVQAQTYPSQPIQLIVPMAPGDTVDLAGRAIATELAKILKTPVIVNNKPGGGSAVGADYVAKGKKNGYTLLFANSNIYYAHAMNPDDVPYNPLTDLDPLCLAISAPLTLAVNADAPWKTFQDLLDYMKKNPGKIRASSTGVGGVGHFNIEVIMHETGAAINMIPYKGASPAMTALMGGHVDISVLSLSLIHPQLEAGKLRALLISKKTPEFPNIPTLKQLGYKNDLSSVLFAFYGPVGLPDSVKKALASPLEKAIKSPEVVKAMEQLGAVEDYVSGPEYKKMMMSEYDMVKKLLKGAGSAPAAK
jgi:tripartite-type tricarboxylate transporter receptor subunit TctC